MMMTTTTMTTMSSSHRPSSTIEVLLGQPAAPAADQGVVSSATCPASSAARHQTNQASGVPVRYTLYFFSFTPPSCQSPLVCEVLTDHGNLDLPAPNNPNQPDDPDDEECETSTFEECREHCIAATPTSSCTTTCSDIVGCDATGTDVAATVTPAPAYGREWGIEPEENEGTQRELWEAAQAVLRHLQGIGLYDEDDSMYPDATMVMSPANPGTQSTRRRRRRPPGRRPPVRLRPPPRQRRSATPRPPPSCASPTRTPTTKSTSPTSATSGPTTPTASTATESACAGPGPTPGPRTTRSTRAGRPAAPCPVSRARRGAGTRAAATGPASSRATAGGAPSGARECATRGRPTAGTRNLGVKRY